MLRRTAGRTGASPTRALRIAGEAQRRGDRGDRDHGAEAVGEQQDRQQRQQGADGEGQHRRHGRLPGAGQLVGIDAELDVEVRPQRVVLGELEGDLAREVLGQPAGTVELGELGELLLRLLRELPGLLVR